MESARGSGIRRTAGMAGLLALAVFGLHAPPAWSAQVCTVTVTADSGPGSLRQALLDLDASDGASCSEIVLPASGTLTLTRNLPTVHWPFSLIGPGAAAFTIEGTGHSILRVRLAGEGHVRVSGVTMRGAGAERGAAVYLYANDDSATLTITDAALTDNAAADSGGAVFVDTASMTISDSRMTANTAREGGGGAIDAAFSNKVLLDGVSFDGNVAGLGGGAVAVSATRTTIRNSRFTMNSGRWGGAAFLAADRTVDIVGSAFVGNSSEESGGGLSVVAENATEPYGVITISTSTFSGNRAGTHGGGAQLSTSDLLLVSDSTFDRNVATKRGGGIEVSDFEGRQDLRNVTITRNRAAVGGGVNLRYETRATFAFSTIVKNRATKAGGGISAQKGSRGLVVAESILFRNRAPSGPDVKNAGRSLRVTSSLLTSRRSVSSRVRAVLSRVLTGVNPRLGPLADNGGPTRTMLPAPTSRAIDAGPARVTDAPADDQRGEGHPRLLGKRYDIGSVEVR